MRTRIALTTAAITAVAALGVAATAPGSSARSQAGLRDVHGADLVVRRPDEEFTPNQSGTKWTVSVTRVKCSFATMWAKKLVKTPFKGEAVTKFKVVPKGWTCMAGGGLLGGGKGTSGNCSKGTNPTVQSKNLLSWGPATPK